MDHLSSCFNSLTRNVLQLLLVGADVLVGYRYMIGSLDLTWGRLAVFMLFLILGLSIQISEGGTSVKPTKEVNRPKI